MVPHNLPDLVDSDRRAVERRALAVLLTCFGQCRMHAYSAARVGADPVRAVYDVLLGNPYQGLPGLAVRLEPILVAAEGAGWKRTTLVIPSPLELAATAPRGYRPTRDYGQYAREAAGKVTATVGRKVSEAVGGAKRGFRSVLDALRGVFSKGYSPENPAALKTAAEVLTGEAYQTGYAAGFTRPEAAAVVKGFEYVAILDQGTTAVCRAYDGVRLPVGHDWLRWHHPMCHFGCRSILAPLVRDFTPTANPPWTPAPQAGFGIAPLAVGPGVAA